MKLLACTVTNKASTKGKVAFGVEQKNVEMGMGRFSYLHLRPRSGSNKAQKTKKTRYRIGCYTAYRRVLHNL